MTLDCTFKFPHLRASAATLKALQREAEFGPTRGAGFGLLRKLQGLEDTASHYEVTVALGGFGFNLFIDDPDNKLSVSGGRLHKNTATEVDKPDWWNAILFAETAEQVLKQVPDEPIQITLQVCFPDIVTKAGGAESVLADMVDQATKYGVASLLQLISRFMSFSGRPVELFLDHSLPELSLGFAEWYSGSVPDGPADVVGGIVHHKDSKVWGIHT